MSATDLMALAQDTGFRNAVEFALFDVAKDKAVGSPASNDLAFLNAILVGEARLDPIVTSVVVINSAPNADDATGLKANIETLWPFLARAWAARTV